jgi:hypothetical protein
VRRRSDPSTTPPPSVRQRAVAPRPGRAPPPRRRAPAPTPPSLRPLHARRRWLQPGPILVSGALFFAAALALDGDEPPLKAAIIAAGPVALYYVLALFVLPSQFSKFAVAYMKTHPELEAQASPRPGGSRDEA